MTKDDLDIIRKFASGKIAYRFLAESIFKENKDDDCVEIEYLNEVFNGTDMQKREVLRNKVIKPEAKKKSNPIL
jgi:hypothetical protein